MKKNLRLLCLGLAAATFTCSFAQQDKTSLLTNADMEQGLKGWVVGGKQIVGKNTKNLSAATGFYGMGQGVLEAWNSNGNGLSDSYIMQRLSDLPNGTYVFGAYVGASKQYHRKDVCVKVDGGVDEDGNKIVNHTLVNDAHQYEYWSNRDSVYGVELFANDAAVRVATNNPDYNSMACVKHGVYRDGHAMKFNVAVTLTEDSEKPGYLDAGLRYLGTNANYVVWDNATLYYFGDMSEAEALDAMAKIDVENAVAITDTLVTKNVVMNVDTLATLQRVLDEARAANVTAANLQEVTNKIFLTAGFARKSAADYEALKKNIESAKVVAAGTWSELNDSYVELLNGVIAKAEEAYAAHELNRAELTALRKELNWTAGDVKLDSLIAAQEELQYFIEGAFSTIGMIGGCTQAQYDELNALAEEVADTFAVFENDAFLGEDMKPMADRTVNSNNLYSYIARINNAIQEVKDNPISDEKVGAFSMILPQSADFINGYKPLDGSVKVANGYSYTSPLMEFGEKKTLIRLTATKIANGNQIYFCISSLEFFDRDGKEIELTAENFYSNADHNSVSGSTDGQSYQGLVDDDPDTYFHSDWSGKITEPHYLEVTLPEGYDAVYFTMVARGEGQRHQFPAEIEVTTPVYLKNLNDLQEQLAAAKALNAYSVPEPGFYVKRFDEVLNAIAKVEAALEGNPSDDECKTLAEELKLIIYNFKKDEEKAFYLPEAGKMYRVISAYTGYYDIQGVEKALTVHAADSTLWWENVCLDSLQQVFEFNPIMKDGEQVLVTEEGKNSDNTTWTQDYYCYTVKNVATGWFIDSAFVDNKIGLAKEAVDTVMLKWLGRGQWNIKLVSGYEKNNDEIHRVFQTFHTGDHNNGDLSTTAGAYGGTYGVSSGIVNWDAGIDGASAWFIREMPELPLTVLAAESTDGDKFKSECIHFVSANTITLTADKECAFANLALYDLYGNAIAIDSLVVSGKTATITATKKNLVACAFEFTNSENVTSVQFDAVVYFSPTALLQEAYDEAVAIAPIEGDTIGQYSDLVAYKAAIAEAEELLENGGSDEAMQKSIVALEEAVKALEPNMPAADEVYSIYSALPYEKNVGVKMSIIAVDESYLRWAGDNVLNLNQYWSFEPATVEDLKAAGGDSTLTNAYYIKNLAYKKYIGELVASDGNTAAMVEGKEDAAIYVVSIVKGSYAVGFNRLNGGGGQYFHANGHGSGSGKGGNVIYYYGADNAFSASAWYIVNAGDTYQDADVDFDEQILGESTDVDFVKADVVVKGIYDLFGRRVAAPTAPGIYIIDGVKRIIK